MDCFIDVVANDFEAFSEPATVRKNVHALGVGGEGALELFTHLFQCTALIFRRAVTQENHHPTAGLYEVTEAMHFPRPANFQDALFFPPDRVDHCVLRNDKTAHDYFLFAIRFKAASVASSTCERRRARRGFRFTGFCRSGSGFFFPANIDGLGMSVIGESSLYRCEKEGPHPIRVRPQRMNPDYLLSGLLKM